MHTDSYSLCVFDNLNGLPRVLASIPSGARWRDLGKRGFRYADKLGNAGGVTDVLLSTAKSSKPTITIAAMGARLGSPEVQPPFPLAVQLKGAGGCWGDSYALDDVEKQTDTVFVVGNSAGQARPSDAGGASSAK